MPPANAPTARDALVARATTFAQDHLRPAARGWDSGEDPVPPALHAALEQHLLLPDWRIADEDTDPVGALQAYEALSWGDAGVAYALHAAALAARIVRTLGTPDQQQSLLPLLSRTAGGETRIGAVALSEPGAGSDLVALTTTATRDGNHYVLNGQKRFITNARDASAMVVYATTDRALGWAGIAPYVVPADTPGLTVQPTARPLGLRAGRYGDLTLADCRIPATHRVGRDEAGPSLRGLGILDSSRPVVAAIAVGLARAAYEYGRRHVKKREQFGRPLATQQAVAFALADMATEIQAARLLTWHAGTMAAEDIPQRQGESSMAKCFAAETAMRVTTEAVQLLGGEGCTEAHPVEKWMRDAKLLEVCEGPSAIQRLIISRAILHA